MDGQKVNYTPHEGEEQARLFSWAEMQSYFHPELRLLFHVPNGGQRSKSEAARFRKEGVKPGVPDVCLPVPRNGYHGLFIELKRQKGGQVSPEQRVWLEKLREQGYEARVCFGWEHAAEAIQNYLREQDDRLAGTPHPSAALTPSPQGEGVGAVCRASGGPR